jgi:hypothetical protein
MELFMKFAEKFCALRERLGRDPSHSSHDLTERKMAMWLSNQRESKKHGTLPADRIAILEAIPGWSWGIIRCVRVYEEVVAKFCALRERLGRDPSLGSHNSTEKQMANWMKHQRSRKKNGTLPADRIAILEAIPGWSWGIFCASVYEKAVTKFCAMRERLGRNPRKSSQDPTEKKMATWTDTQRQRKNNGTLPADRIAILEAIPGWRWAKPRKNAT